MAILFCRAQVIKRSEGRSAVACAAYRGGLTLEDSRTGQTHDYTRKQGVEAEGIAAPKGAPEWAYDPQQLWNRAEAAETRKDAQLARELVIALPHELDARHREYLVKNILRDATRQGMTAHYFIHAPGREGDDRNHHAHVMLTMRRFTREGEFSGKKERAWNDRAALKGWKQTIERETNRMMERAGLEARVSVELEDGQQPTRHLGPKAAFLERQGVQTELGEHNRRVQAANQQRRERAELEREIEQAEAELAAERERANQPSQQAFDRLKEQWAARSRPSPSPANDWNPYARPSNDNRPERAPEPPPRAQRPEQAPQAPPERDPAREQAEAWDRLQKRYQAPRTRAARAFEQAQQPETAPQPEPPRRRTEQREAFNEAARAPEAPQQARETSREGDSGSDSQTQANRPAPVNKRRPRAQTAEEMRARQKERGGRTRERMPDRE